MIASRKGGTDVGLEGYRSLVCAGRSVQPAFTQLRRLILLWLSSIQHACLEHVLCPKCGVERRRGMNIRRCVKLIPTVFYAGARKFFQKSTLLRRGVKSCLHCDSRRCIKTYQQSTLLRKCAKAVFATATAETLRTPHDLATL